MVIVKISVKIKPEMLEIFIGATNELGNLTRQEGGNLRYEVLQQENDPTRFVIQEIYKDDDAMNAHFNAPHFEAWRSAVAATFAEAGTSTRYQPMFPSPSSWVK